MTETTTIENAPPEPVGSANEGESGTTGPAVEVTAVYRTFEQDTAPVLSLIHI